MLRHKPNDLRCRAYGGASAANILGLAIVFIVFSVCVWAGSLGVTYMEVETATNNVAATMASAGCWNAESTNVLDHSLANFGALLPPDHVTVEHATSTYTPYGQRVSLTLTFPFLDWSGSGPTGRTLRFTISRRIFSTAPSSADDGTPACTTPPLYG